MSTTKTQSDNSDFGNFLSRYVESDPERSRRVANAELHLSLAAEIYRLRTDREMTQKDLADAIGSKQSVIARLEDAEYQGHSLNLLQNIAYALKLRLSVGFYAKADPPELTFTQQRVVECDSDWPEDVPTTVD